MSFVIPSEVLKRANEIANGRGSVKMGILMDYARTKLQAGEQIVDWRLTAGTVTAVTGAIPDQSASPIPEKYRDSGGLK